MNARTPHNVVPDYIAHGWKLCAVPEGSKGVNTPGWNIEENALAEPPQSGGVGLMHAYSNTMAFDIDDGVATVAWFKDRNIDIREWFLAADSVRVESGTPNHTKLLFKLPPLIGPMPTKKVVIDKKTIFELRCATLDGLSVMDVLPPSLHPNGNQYTWAGKGSWQALPDVPVELMGIWSMLLTEKHTSAPVGDPTDVNWDEVKDAIGHIPASICHEDWLEVIMGLHSTRHAEAYDLARSWSASCAEKYPGDSGFNTRWRSFSTDKQDGITIASVFHHAKEHGWVAPPVDVSKLFNAPPENILDGMFMPPPIANLDLFPAGLRDPAIEVSETIGCDPIIPIFAGLGAVMAAVDARSRLKLWEGYEVPPLLWLGGIGGPADKKSPGSKPMYSVLGEIERDDRARYTMDMLRWEAEEAMYAAAKKSMLQQAEKGEHALNAGGGDILTGLTSVPELRAQPVPKRLVISDTTTQKAVRICADRPQGLLCNLDETHGFMKKLTNPTGGEDRSSLVAGYNVEPYFMDRVGAGSVIAENLAIAIYGCFQPEVLKQYTPLLKSDGFIQRFVFAVFNSKYRRTSKPIPKWTSIKPQWDHLVRQIHAAGERHYTLSAGAYDLMREFEQEGIDLTNRYETAQQSPILVTTFGKLLGTAGRLMFLFHLIKDRDSLTVSEQTARNAIAFIRSYVVPCWHYLVESILGDESLDRHVCEYIIQVSNEATITLSELKRGLRRKLDGIQTSQAGEMIRGVMGELEGRQWVAVVEDTRKSTVWAIHPSLVTTFAEHRKRIVDSKAAIRQSILEAAAVRRSEKNV